MEFNFGPLMEQVKFKIEGSLTFNPNLVSTNSNTLEISMRLTSPQAITITQQSFPVLQRFNIDVLDTDHTFSLTMDAKPYSFMPQCQSCSLDPDFAPLLIDKSNDSGCSKSNTWRIIVGVVVGVFGAVAIVVASIIQRVTKRFNKNMQQKLARMS
ncbi:hypothetical protein DFA_09559 [Cavenderia fasciculata]|uniref:Uncharacterized protein n=1 Tax=Cavenderia fasciculata TaxID=261658 RepID=F4Q7Z0_CACFS|nr:uncharacterized protein DFA_09559 [Cavenderia fasciculata]EGG15890.1 hypothetical protein DFA_09559 [Cavenderia fasciculata]|eukprot:XP_004352215.1 hypothetical protein DFA_09559 [Cavenderia fasciculata]